jgi:hypothetical protein
VGSRKRSAPQSDLIESSGEVQSTTTTTATTNKQTNIIVIIISNTFNTYSHSFLDFYSFSFSSNEMKNLFFYSLKIE